MNGISEVRVFDEPGLYEASSSSATLYYLDTRDPTAPRYMRWRNPGMTLTSPMDNRWHELTLTGASPDEHPDESSPALEWTLKVGWYHTYCTTREGDHPNGPLYWVSSRVCEQIRRLDTMPPPDARAKTDAWFPPDRLVALIAVAVPHEEGWVAFVPNVPGLAVFVDDLDAAQDALTLHAAVLTGRDQRDFLVSVHYVPDTDVQP